MLQLLLPPEHAARLLLEAFLRVQGGKGSGNFGHEGRPGEIGGSAAELTNVKTTFPKRFHVRIESDQGFITLLRTDDFEGPMGQQVLVGDIEVKPQYRKQGFALALYESALEYAVSVGAKNVTSTGALSQDAKDLWKRFEKYGRASVNEEGDRVFLPLKTLGGPGSGNFGHAGRPGQVGGSSDSGGVAVGLESDPYEHYPNAPDTRKLKFDADDIGEQLLEDGALDEEGFLSLYHVTGSDPDQILKEGLIPGKKPAPGQDWEADHAKYATYFFRSKEHALDQAEQAGEGFSVIRAQLPVTEQVLRRLVPDEDTGLTPMQGVQALLAGENVGVIGGVPAYALQPVSTSKRKARGLGGPGSGYFGHAGRPGEVGGSKGDSWTQKDIQEDRVLNGVPLRRIDNPDFSKGVNHSIKEDPLYIPERKTASAGVIVVEPDGRVWIVSPKNYYGGYRNTFSKGTVDSGEYLQEAALRELWEETGLVAKVTAPLIDVQRSTSVARYYIGKRVDGAPWAAGKETHRVKLVSLDDPKLDKDLRNVWGKETADHDVLDALREHFGKLKAAGGQGSGNFGHVGRPGQIGGSAPDEGGSGSVATAPNEQFKPSDWPIHDDVIRDIGTFYPGEMQSQGNQWTGEEARVAVGDAVNADLSKFHQPSFVLVRKSEDEDRVLETLKFNENQARDSKGRWTGGGDTAVKADQHEAIREKGLARLRKDPEAAYGRVSDLFKHARPVDRKTGTSDPLPPEVASVMHGGSKLVKYKKTELLDPNAKNILAVQAGASSFQVEEFIKAWPKWRASKPPTVVRVGKTDYITDGHHRLAAAKFLGVKIPVSVFVAKDTNRVLGGKGSGNFGHEGRPGQVGGSGDSGGTPEEKIDRLPLVSSDDEDSVRNPLLPPGIEPDEDDENILEYVAENFPDAADALTTAKKTDTGPVSVVSLKDVVTQQSTLSKAVLRKYVKENKVGPNGLAIKVGKKYIIVDGNHRIVAAALRGSSVVGLHIIGKVKRFLEVDEERALGGPGSGHHNHAGRPGEVGGSASGDAATVSDVLTGKKVSGPQGSNPGGAYIAKDGSKWYAKTYRDSDQAFGEHAANSLYRQLGVGAPRSTVGEHNGKIVYASRWLDTNEGTLAEVGLNKQNANSVLDGFVADAFTGNWDAVGTGLDNVVVFSDGSVSRIDNGGTFLHRAMGSLKTEAALEGVTEWQTLSNSQYAPYYSRVFKAAGLKGADDLGERAIKQIDKVIDVREKHGGWRAFLDDAIPTAPKAYREKLGRVLESRTKSLEQIRARLAVNLKTAGGPGSGFYDHKGRPGKKGGSQPEEGSSFGSTEEFTVTVKKKAPKAPPVPLDAKKQAYEEVKKGGSFKLTAAKYGMTQGQLAGYVWKTDQKKTALVETLTPPEPIVEPQIVIPTPPWEESAPAPDVSVVAPEPPPFEEVTKPFANFADAASVAEKNNFQWGKSEEGDAYAWFNEDGIQISEDGLAGDKEKTAKTITMSTEEAADLLYPDPSLGITIPPSTPLVTPFPGYDAKGHATITPFAEEKYPASNALKQGFTYKVTPDGMTTWYDSQGNAVATGVGASATAKLITVPPDYLTQGIKDQHLKPFSTSSNPAEAAESAGYNWKSVPGSEHGDGGYAWFDETGKQVSPSGNFPNAMAKQIVKTPDAPAPIPPPTLEPKSISEMSLEEKKASAYAEVKGGSKFKDTAAKYGMTQGQLSGYVWKTDQKLKKEGTAAQTPTTISQEAKTVTPPALPKTSAQEPAVEPKSPSLAGKSWTALNAEQKLEIAAQEKYVWKEKTHGPKSGQYAWFDATGTQVSAPYPEKGQHREGLDTINYGKGIEIFTGGESIEGWPIGGSTVRTMGSKYPGVVKDHFQPWLDKLPGTESKTITSYTGSTYNSVNDALRDKTSGSYYDQGLRIMSALNKAPGPPPPELVWRGVNAPTVKKMFDTLGNGDEVQLGGIQSASIKPSFAYHWGGANLFLEIKPKRGGFVDPISLHKNSEWEYLLPHNSTYRIRGINKIKLAGVSHPVKVFQLEEL